MPPPDYREECNAIKDSDAFVLMVANRSLGGVDIHSTYVADEDHEIELLDALRSEVVRIESELKAKRDRLA